VTVYPPASSFWGITQTVIYGSSQIIIPFAAGIVDTGTTLLFLPSNAFQTYQNATGGELDPTTGLLKISDAQFEELESLFFFIGGITLEFVPNAQIWPRELNGVIGGEENAVYLIVADSGAIAVDPTAIQFINGFTWLYVFFRCSSVFWCTDSLFSLTVSVSTPCLTRTTNVLDSQTLISLKHRPTNY
jgi:Eukaryotic aspartyl protease